MGIENSPCIMHYELIRTGQLKSEAKKVLIDKAFRLYYTGNIRSRML